VYLAKSPTKIEENLQFQGFLNKNSPQAHMDLELSVFDVAIKLGENIDHLCKK
jgi:hypothetical protein